MYLTKRFKIAELFDLVHNRNSLMLLANLFDLEFVRAAGHTTYFSKYLRYQTIVVKDDDEFLFHPLWIMSKHLIIEKGIYIDHHWSPKGPGKVSFASYVYEDKHVVGIPLDLDIVAGRINGEFSIDQITKLAELAGVILIKQIKLGIFEEGDFDR